MKWEEFNLNEKEEKIFLGQHNLIQLFAKLNETVEYLEKNTSTLVEEYNRDNSGYASSYEITTDQYYKSEIVPEIARLQEYAIALSILPESPSYTKIKVKLNKILASIDETDKAKILKKVREEYVKSNLIPDEKEKKYMEILHLLMQNNNAKAIEKCNALIKEYPEYHKAIWLSGRIYQDMVKFPEAIAQYQKLIEQAPESKYAENAKTKLRMIYPEHIAKQAVAKAMQYFCQNNSLKYTLSSTDQQKLIEIIKEQLNSSQVFDEQFQGKYCEHYADKIAYNLDSYFTANYLNAKVTPHKPKPFNFDKLSQEAKSKLIQYLKGAISFVKDLIKSIPTAPLATLEASAPLMSPGGTLDLASAPPMSRNGTLTSASAPPMSPSGTLTYQGSFYASLRKCKSSIRSASASLAKMQSQSNYPGLFASVDGGKTEQPSSLPAQSNYADISAEIMRLVHK